MQTIPFPYKILLLLCAAAIGTVGVLYPLNNWDLIGYIASALSNSGLSGEELHSATYGDLSQALSANKFTELTQNGPYVAGVFRDPVALEQQLAFYRIRPIYVTLVQAVGVVTPNLTWATYLISALSAAALSLLTGTYLFRQMPGVHWGVIGAGLVVILYLTKVPDLARLSTPDGLFAVCALLAMVLFYPARGAAMALIVALPLIRTDSIVLTVLITILLAIERDRRLTHYAAVAMSAALYLWTNTHFGAYSHAVLFNLTFISGQRTPYPETLAILRDPSIYIDAYKNAAAGMLTRWVPYILLIAAAGAVFDWSRSRHITPLARLALLSIAYVLVHFLAFPMGASRHYAFALIICSIYIAQMVSNKLTKAVS